MSTFSVSIEVGSADRSAWREVKVLVDTGATFTWLPRDVLEELGHKPTMSESFRLGDGRIMDSEIADVPVRISGKMHATICAFAEAGVEPVLGAVTLEQFLQAPDPVNQRLVPVVGLHVTRRES